MKKHYLGYNMEKQINTLSILQQFRLKYTPKLPKILKNLKNLHLLPIEDQKFKKQQSAELSKLLPTLNQAAALKPIEKESLATPFLKVGVVLSGGQAAGGHNVITGLFDALKALNSENQLFGFLNGPAGIIKNKSIEITDSMLALYRNQGGFDLLGSGRTKIETEEQFQVSEQTVKALNLDGLVIIGGDDSNTNAALLAEYFNQKKCKTKVIGVPKTIDGDLKNEWIEISFGFDSACKTYSEIIGNVLRDALSQKKYYFFIKVMGRSASHIALECALQTHPNLTLIGEEVEAQKLTVQDITNIIADMICRRSNQKKDFGVLLIPEGIIEFIPECKALIEELNHLMVKEEKVDSIASLLTPTSTACFKSLPPEVQSQLLLDRDPHGNVQVSKIESDRLFIETVKKELAKRKKEGNYDGKFEAQPLFCGYEGRSCLPSNFDSHYCYSLGHVGALLINQGFTGYMAYVQKLAQPIADWQIGAVPLVNLMDLEHRKGKIKPVVCKAKVDLKGAPYLSFIEQREKWAINEDYCYPGPIQFFGPELMTESITQTLQAESKKNNYSE
jgi:diphosphate-dependent phosphofructokinase